MRAHDAVPAAVVERWRCQTVTHATGAEFPAHYHEVEEWLKVEGGRISFTDVTSNETYAVDEGQCLEIPAGSVHRVRVDRDVAYEMWTPLESEPPFQRVLSALPCLPGVTEKVLADLVFSNFEVPRLENRITEGQEEARAALLALLHPLLQFRQGNGAFVGRERYQPAPSGQRSDALSAKSTMWRERSSGFAVLHLTPIGALVSIDVHTVDTATSPPVRKRFRNLRGFALEQGRWQCRVWMNYPIESA
jgi:hypothetical protein